RDQSCNQKSNSKESVQGSQQAHQPNLFGHADERTERFRFAKRREPIEHHSEQPPRAGLQRIRREWPRKDRRQRTQTTPDCLSMEWPVLCSQSLKALLIEHE